MLSQEDRLAKKDELLTNYAVKSERIHTINQLLKDIDAEQPLESLAIWKPFSFVLVDDDRETVAELMLFDEDNTLLSQSLMQGLDEELDSFLKDLLAE